MDKLSQQSLKQRADDYQCMLQEIHDQSTQPPSLTADSEVKWTFRWMEQYHDKLKLVQVPSWIIPAINSDPYALNFFWTCCIFYVSRLEARSSWKEYPVPDAYVKKFGCRWLVIEYHEPTADDSREFVSVRRQ